MLWCGAAALMLSAGRSARADVMQTFDVSEVFGGGFQNTSLVSLDRIEFEIQGK